MLYDPATIDQRPDDGGYGQLRQAMLSAGYRPSQRQIAAAQAPPADDLPDAPWLASAKPRNEFDQFDAPAERTWGDTARSAWDYASPVIQAAGRAIPGPMGAAAAGVRNIDPALAGEAISNIPGSAVEFAKNTAQPFLHPQQTLTDIGDVGSGLAQKLGVGVGDANPEDVAKADAVGKFFADRYGGIENLKRTMATDPVGFLGDLSTVLTGGGAAAARAPGMVGRVGEVARAAGQAVDPITLAARGAAPVAKLATELGPGLATGVGGTPLQLAAKAGYEGGPAAQAFREHISGAAPGSDAVADARGALAEIRQQRGKAYREAMQELSTDQRVLNFDGVDEAMRQASGVKTFKGQDISPTTQTIRHQIADTIAEWRALDPAEFHTAEGLDALKQKIGDIRDATQYGTPERVVADRVYQGVRKTIIDSAPEYAKTMKAYEQASDLVKDIEKTLSMNPKASIDTSLRKLQSVLRNNVNTSFGHRAELAEFLVRAGAPNLMQKLAGQALNTWAPRGLARLIGPMETAAVGAAGVGAGSGLLPAAAAAVPALALASPRLMGEAYYGAGRAARAAKPLRPVRRAARQIGQVDEAATSELPDAPWIK